MMRWKRIDRFMHSDPVTPHHSWEATWLSHNEIHWLSVLALRQAWLCPISFLINYVFIFYGNIPTKQCDKLSLRQIAAAQDRCGLPGKSRSNLLKN